MVRKLVLALTASCATLLGAAPDAAATAIFGVLSQTSVSLVGIDHGEVGNGVNVQSGFDPEDSWIDSVGDVRSTAFSDAFAEEGLVELASFSFGEAFDGAATAWTRIAAWFDVSNDSANAVVVHFSVSWLLEAETLVNSGLAQAAGGILVTNSFDGAVFQQSIDVRGRRGDDSRTSQMTREFAMIVPPHEGHVFWVSVFAEGSSSAGSSAVPEPLTASLLALALAAAAAGGGRLRSG